ncbi:methyltransferase [Flavobacteriaceae bacterium]|jgi:hypothetical protein|nr:methyltransferase [Flavobacteriaceae bacterium]
MYEKSFPNKRFKLTIEFLKKYVTKNDTILDLGVSNPLTKIIIDSGLNVTNTQGEDLDLDQSALKKSNATVVTAFEIFEHLLSPFEVLKNIQSDKLVASVPLKLWFASAYRSSTDDWDRHYHEFEDWQFNWLLEKTGWKIIDSQKWTNPIKKIGVRPLLRWFVPRYYIVYAEKIK